jgi:hypothetical protein
MPIRTENRDRYPADWPQISQRIRERAGWKCEWCGVHNGALGGRSESGRWWEAAPLDCSGRRPSPGEIAWCDSPEGDTRRLLRITRIVLTVAHVRDPAPENCALENLAALCQRCHLNHDRKHHLAVQAGLRRLAMATPDLFGGAA